MKLGFIGLGVMGAPMARNLARAGEVMVVSSASDRHFAEFIANGAKASTDSRVIADCDIVFLCLPEGAVVEQVLFGSEGLGPLLSRGAAVVDLSTTGYSETREIGARLDALGIGFMDAPVSGMAARAIDGTLTIMCGGEKALFDRVQPLLERMGSSIIHMGDVGAGQLAKLVNQLLFDINMAALAEILPMAAAIGLDPAQVELVVNSGTGRSYASEFFVPRILAGLFHDGYPMEAAYKDLVSAARLSAEAGIPLPLTAAATTTYQMALRRGHGKLDKGGMIRVFEELLGVEFRKQDET